MPEMQPGARLPERRLAVQREIRNAGARNRCPDRRSVADNRIWPVCGASVVKAIKAAWRAFWRELAIQRRRNNLPDPLR